jgi:hypothetical protein
VRVVVEFKFCVSFVIEAGFLEMLCKVREEVSMLYTIISQMLNGGWAGVVAFLGRLGAGFYPNEKQDLIVGPPVTLRAAPHFCPSLHQFNNRVKCDARTSRALRGRYA